MGTKVQSKTYFPGSMRDLNSGFCNGTWDLYHDNGISGSVNSQFYDSFLMRQAVDGYKGYAKEQMRQTILKQESIFRHQLQELHRLYKRQRDLMNELARQEHCNHPTPAETSKSSHFQSQTPSEVSKETHILISNFHKVDSTFGPPHSKCGASQRIVIDLEQPANEDENDDGKQQVEDVRNLCTERTYNLADLNEPIQVEETSFSASKLQRRDSSVNSSSGFLSLSKFSRQNVMERDGRICSSDGHVEGEGHKMEQPSYNFTDGKTKRYNNGYSNSVFSHQSNSLQVEPTKAFEHAEPQRKRTIFGVELDHTPSFDPSSQTPELFAGKNHINHSTSRFTSSRAGVGFLSDINSKNSLSDSPEEPRPMEKLNVTDGLTSHESRLPHWLFAKSTKGNETKPYQMNLDSLQNHSQQFFKKAETDKCQSITKILGVPIVDMPQNSKDLARKDIAHENSKDLARKDHAHDPKVENLHEAKDLVVKNGESNCLSDLRHHIDLNLSCNEEEAPQSAPESAVKIDETEIDLEAPPAVLESETESPEINLDIPSKTPLNDDSKDTHLDLEKVAAEAIMSISSCKFVRTRQPPEEPPLLWWFADVITSHDDVSKDSVDVKNDHDGSIPEGMDYFEFMTLKLQDTKEEYYNYKPMILGDEKEEEAAMLPKRTTRKGQGKRGRQRRDFQRDVLPGIVSLSRREVSEDLQTFEEAFTAIGVPWQSRLLKRKGGRGRRQVVVSDSSPQTPPPAAAAVAALEQSICREVAVEEKRLRGWGKRTRRLPRQRCQNGGGNHHSLALKC